MAADEGLYEIVVNILGDCPSSSHAGPFGRTALHAAVINGNSDIIDALLISRVGIIKEADNERWSPLHFAAFLGSLNNVKLLIGTDKSIVYLQDKDGITALHLAANKGHLSIIRYIILVCPDWYEIVDNRARNFLHFAVESGKASFFLKLLLVHKFIISFMVNEEDNEGNTPIHLALITNNFSIAKFLIQYTRVDKQAINMKNQTFHDILLSKHICEGMLDTRINYTDYVMLVEMCKKEKLWLDYGKISKGQEAETTIKQVDAGRNEFERQLSDSHLLVATLIATVTFTAGFTLPGGYKNDAPDEGMAILSRKTAFRAFLVSDTIAMCFSTAAVYLHFIKFYFPERKTNSIYLKAAARMTQLAMFAMQIAFGTGTYVVLSHSQGLALFICIISSSFWFLFVIIVVVLHAYRLYFYWWETRTMRGCFIDFGED